MFALSEGIKNTALGTYALEAVETGSRNTAVGFSAGKGVTTGELNVFLGYLAGAALGNVTKKLVISNNEQYAVIMGVMAETEERNVLELMPVAKGKIGFYGVTPVVRHATISGVTEETKVLKEKLEQVIAAIKAIGIIE